MVRMGRFRWYPCSLDHLWYRIPLRPWQPAGLDPAYFHTCDSDAPVVDNADAVTAPLAYILLWMLERIFFTLWHCMSSPTTCGEQVGRPNSWCHDTAAPRLVKQPTTKWEALHMFLLPTTEAQVSKIHGVQAQVSERKPPLQYPILACDFWKRTAIFDYTHYIYIYIRIYSTIYIYIGKVFSEIFALLPRLGIWSNLTRIHLLGKLGSSQPNETKHHNLVMCLWRSSAIFPVCFTFKTCNSDRFGTCQRLQGKRCRWSSFRATIRFSSHKHERFFFSPKLSVIRFADFNAKIPKPQIWMVLITWHLEISCTFRKSAAVKLKHPCCEAMRKLVFLAALLPGVLGDGEIFLSLSVSQVKGWWLWPTKKPTVDGSERPPEGYQLTWWFTYGNLHVSHWWF